MALGGGPPLPDLKLLKFPKRKLHKVDRPSELKALHSDLHKAIDKHRGDTSYAAVIGVLVSVQQEILEESYE